MNYEAVLFDLDGTLLDTREDVGNAMNRVLTSKCFPTHTTEQYGIFLGSGARSLVIKSLPEDRRDPDTIAECLKTFRQDYQQNCTIKTAPYAGIPELLDVLVARKIKLGILTNKPQDTTEVCIRELLSEWPFEVVIGMQDGRPSKPDPTGALEAASEMGVVPEKILYVGDTEIDMKTSLNAGMDPIGVAWGFREIDELVESGAQAIIHHPLELLDHI
jgi:phosphoglycolate phosphatase